MQMILSIAVVVQIISAVAVIVLVLLQHGKGADLGAAFGSGASGSVFGASSRCCNNLLLCHFSHYDGFGCVPKERASERLGRSRHDDDGADNRHGFDEG